MIVVRLIRKLADQIDGIDLQHSHVGDMLYVSAPAARLLIAEGWAQPLEDHDLTAATKRLFNQSKPE